RPSRVPGPAVPYEVACSCGQVVRGTRQARHQVVTCAGCGQAVFVLPFSAYAPPDQSPRGELVPPRDAARYPVPFSFLPRPWGVPLLAAVLTLTAVVAGYALILKQFGRSVAPPGAARAPEQEIRAYMDAGQKAMSEGSFRLALEELDRAREL